MELNSKDHQRVAQIARRNVQSEVVLILTAGFAFLMVLAFLFGPYTFLPLAERLVLPPTIAWFGLSFGVASIWAWIHARRLGPKVADARAKEAELLEEYRRKQARERWTHKDQDGGS